MRNLSISLWVTLFAFFLSSPLEAAPFTNGSFEIGTNLPKGFRGVKAGSTDIDGWVVNSNIDWVGTYWQPSHGSYSIDMCAGRGSGNVSQTFDTNAGQKYQVLFDMAGNPDGSPAEKRLEVSVAGYQQTYTFNKSGHKRNNMGWQEESFFFTAADDVTTLMFDGITAGAYGAAIDNIRVGAVPIPGAVWLLGSGILGLVGIRRSLTK